MVNREIIKQEIDKLNEEELQLVVDFIAFLQFRVHNIDISTQEDKSEIHSDAKAIQSSLEEVFTKDIPVEQLSGILYQSKRVPVSIQQMNEAIEQCGGSLS